MRELQIETLEERLSVLEQEVAGLQAALECERARGAGGRRLGRGATAALLVAGAVATFAIGRPQAQAGAQVLTVKAPFTVLDDSGKPLAFIGEGERGESGLIVNDTSGRTRASVTVGPDNFGYLRAAGDGDAAAVMFADGTGPVLRLRGGDTKYVLNVTSEQSSIRAPLSITTAAGKPAVELKESEVTVSRRLAVRSATGTDAAALSDHSGGLLTLGQPAKGGVDAGVGKSGGGFIAARTSTGTYGVALGQHLGAGFGAYVLGPDGEQVQASLALDEAQKGRLRVGDPSGARTVIGATKDGGVSLAMFVGDGGDRLGAYAGPAKSFVRVTGSGQVRMESDTSQAALHVFNKQGSAAASLVSTGSGFGQFTLGNAAGDTIVEAGTTTDGLGIVRAGPRIGGPIGGLVLPFAILGHK